MKILVVSDSHNDNDTLKRIANKYNNCDYYLHLGDSQASKEDIYPFISVKGNCDYFSNDFELSKLIKTPVGNIFLEHIPFYYSTIHSLKKDKVRLYLHGHTHIKKDETIKGIRIINPGSISYPRDGSSSFCIIDMDENNINVEFIDLKDL